MTGVGGIQNIQFLDELRQWLEDSEIPMSEVCLTGSAVLAYYGIRNNNDLEIIVNDCMKDKVKLSDFEKIHLWGHIPVSDNIDIFKNQYAVIGYSDKYIFNKKCYIDVDGIKIVAIEYEYLYKKFLLKYLKYREKDINDIKMIEEIVPDKARVCDNLLRDRELGLYYSLIGVRIHVLNREFKRIYRVAYVYISTAFYYIKKIFKN